MTRARRLLYTWRDVFESDMLNIRRTDLIEHSMELLPGAVPHKAKLPLYSEEEMEFSNKITPKMEQAGLILRCDSDWGARTKYPPKPNKDVRELRVVHNYININRWTRKSQYPTPRLAQTDPTSRRRRCRKRQRGPAQCH